MNIKRFKCYDCGHANDDHSVYRDLCLISGCTCTTMGGMRYMRRRRSRYNAIKLDDGTVVRGEKGLIDA